MNKLPDGNSSSIASTLLIVSSGHVLLILEILAIFLLTRKKAHKIGPLKTLMLVLSSIEFLLCTSILLYELLRCIETTVSNSVEKSLSTIFFISLNTALVSRNWIVALIAATRCEAVVSPLKNHHRAFFSIRKQKIMSICIVLLSALFSGARILVKIFKPHTDSTFSKVFFVYQSVIPILVIISCALFIIAVMVFRDGGSSSNIQNEAERRNSSVPKKEPAAADERRPLNGRLLSCTGNELGVRNNSIRCSRGSFLQFRSGSDASIIGSEALNYQLQLNWKISQVKVTRMVVLMLIIFTVLESPVTITIFFEIERQNFLLKILVIANSYANLIIYLFMSKKFRALAEEYLCRHRRLQTRVCCHGCPPFTSNQDRRQSNEVHKKSKKQIDNTVFNIPSIRIEDD
ncbi:hypothetical protein Ciccas_006487 [Cichlidogyrus casuarinus]|uniref:G-protein coupled receptors family 1 profile domain-containing protein n=1 Tax=Cichlidogyrus casuarinus TaxID=1844966 RepID=A0ABD2Q5L6_9PLAT